MPPGRSTPSLPGPASRRACASLLPPDLRSIVFLGTGANAGWTVAVAPPYVHLLPSGQRQITKRWYCSFGNERQHVLSLTLNAPLARPPGAGSTSPAEGRKHSANPLAVPTFDCLVLSGGGAKGAYGAGVAKALMAYRQLKGVRGPVCYVGASAGALNAYVLATANADDLISFWLAATRRNILGPRFPSITIRAMLRLATRPFSIYSNAGLESLIRANASISTIKNPLIIATTDYTRGELKAFYASKLIDKLVEDELQTCSRPATAWSFSTHHDDRPPDQDAARFERHTSLLSARADHGRSRREP